MMVQQVRRGPRGLIGATALSIILMAGAAMAQDAGEEPVLEDPGPGELIDPLPVEGGDGEIVVICFDCSGEPVDLGEGGEVPGDEGGEVPVDDSGEVPVDDGGEVPGGDGGDIPEEVYFPTSDCGGCEAWADGGPRPAPELSIGTRSYSLAYRQALCADPAFDQLELCAGLAAE